MSEKPKIEKLDFSKFHPLDHSVWLCMGYPGGIRRHIEYAWLFRWEPALARVLLCSIGLHRWCEGWKHREGEEDTPFTICDWCYKEQL